MTLELRLSWVLSGNDRTQFSISGKLEFVRGDHEADRAGTRRYRGLSVLKMWLLIRRASRCRSSTRRPRPQEGWMLNVFGTCCAIGLYTVGL
jgi:hypothetical protein